MNQQPESGLHRAVTTLAQAIGAITAVLFTPDVFHATQGFIHAQFLKMWDDDIASLWTVLTAVLEGVIIYSVVWLSLSALIIGGMTSWATRRFRGR